MPTMSLDQAFQLGVQHHSAGRLAEAENIYRQILAVAPNHAECLHRLGALAGQAGRHQAAADLIQKAIALSPNQPGYHCNLGNTYNRMGRWDEAIPCFQRALQLMPDLVEAHFNLGSALHAKKRVDDAIACYQRALTLRPGYAQAHNNLGSAWKDKGHLDQAIACYRQALAADPRLVDALYNLGRAWQDKGQLDDAIACYRRALECQPDSRLSLGNLGVTLKDTGQLDEAITCWQQALAMHPDCLMVHNNLLYSLPFHPATTAQGLLEESRRWDQRQAAPLRALIGPHDNDRSPDRRLRIGYISAHFADHCQAFFTVPLLSSHDHEHFEIFCYADVQHPSAITAHLRSCADVWRDIASQSDETVAQRIRQDRIDILIDLALHMEGNRLLVFARKPAPVQVTWLGYPGTTGLGTMDYRLTDPYLDPPGVNDACYSEKSIRLPHTFWCYAPLTQEPAVNSLPAAAADHITFGCLNNFCKINQGVLSLWARIMTAVAGSRLLLLAPGGASRQRVAQTMQRHGISPDRIEFVDRQPRPQYLELYSRIDIGLDTFPYNGHTTSLDSFWMGVPVVTLVGQTVVGRAGLCQLTNLGLEELIAHTPEQFVQAAADLAGDLPRLSGLRAALRPRMESSPLMDGKNFARGIEAAYRTMWKTWCASA